MTFQLALKFLHVIASLLEMEVFQKTELWKNDLSLT